MQPSVIYDFNPRSLPENLLAAIGLTIQASAQTEDILNAAIGGCLGLDAEYMIAVTAHMSVPLKISVLHSAAEIRLDDLDALDRLDDLIAEIKKCLEKRNEAAHDNFCVHPHTKQVYRCKAQARTSVSMELKPVEIDRIVKDASAIYDSGMALMRFIIEHNLIPALPDMRPRFHKTKNARKARRTKMGK